jgi:phospholipid/cholesterol/gamma-HCH transport system ATP-binding protein
MGITSIVVSHDIQSTFRIADKIIILFHGKIVAEGTVDEIKNSDDERVIQFINGKPEGPIPFNITKKDFLEDLLIP